MVLPEGFAFPPLIYILSLLGVGLIVILALARDDPPVTAWTVLGFVPWMAAGGALHVLYVERIVGEPMRPLFGTPAVYGFTAILAGIAWLVALREPVDGSVPRPVPLVLGILGTIAFVLPALVILVVGIERGSFSPAWPTVAIVLSILVTTAFWGLFVRALPDVADTIGVVGLVVVFGHVLDAISTAVGIDILGAAERSPVPRLIMDVAGTLPTAELIGTGWAFVLVKIMVAAVVLWLFEPFVRETPRQAYLLLGLIAAVGLGPAVHNLLLFAIAA